MFRLLISIFFLFIVSSVNSANDNSIAIAIHGGAGTILKNKLTDEKEAQIRSTLKFALESGYGVLKSGGSSVDAVTATIIILENSPLFNAGKGAVYTNKQTHELDASIMEGHTLNAGAIASVTQIKNPITLAKAVMQKSKHVLLVGEGAEEFAKQNNLEFVENSYFDTQFRLNQLFKAQGKPYDKNAILWAPDLKKFGTVGAVALDKSGHLAAATSTGGMTNKMWGRVGDSPIIGAGTYANDSCAISATGHGEFFIRANVAADICARMKYRNSSIRTASENVVNVVLKDMGAEGGVIAMDNNGNIATPFNTAGMYRAFISTDGVITVKIFKD